MSNDTDRILDAIAGLRSEMTTRMNRIQSDYAMVRDEIAFTTGAVENLKNGNEELRQGLRILDNQVNVMWRQLKALEAKVRDLDGGA